MHQPRTRCLPRAVIAGRNPHAVVGAILLVGEHKSTLSTVLGTIAIVAATSNVVGDFMITDRMLKMFKSSRPQKP